MGNNRQQQIPDQIKQFISDDSIVVRSPGRINLIGEHTDYNDGFVLPAAIDKAVYVVVDKKVEKSISLYSVNFNETVEINFEDIKPVHNHWSTYVLGVVDQLLKRQYAITGFRLTIYGDIPLGAGLSSSAAVECATAFALNELFQLNSSRIELTKLAQQAEHEFAGVKCGIMDQFASMFGKKDKVMRLDCRSLEYEYFPVDLNGYKIVLFDSQVKHSLASTEYNVRRSECEEGVALIKKKFPNVKSLRDVSLDMIDECINRNEIIYKRCRYVVEENSRLQQGCDDLLKKDITSFGKKMYATHTGLSEQYAVSCKELDFLVENVKQLPAVIGARMMGGGFGGCTINIIKENDVNNVIENVSTGYKKSFQKELNIYIVKPEEGTSIIN